MGPYRTLAEQTKSNDCRLKFDDFDFENVKIKEYIKGRIQVATTARGRSVKFKISTLCDPKRYVSFIYVNDVRFEWEEARSDIANANKVEQKVLELVETYVGTLPSQPTFLEMFNL